MCAEEAFLQVFVAGFDSRTRRDSIVEGFVERIGSLAIEELGNGDLFRWPWSAVAQREDAEEGKYLDIPL